MIQPGMHVQQGFNKTAMSSGCETQMPFTITIEEPTELPNGMYAEGTLFGGGGFKVHCPAGTTYTAVCELIATWVVTPELLSTELRTVGHGSCYAISKMGSFLAPYLVVSQVGKYLGNADESLPALPALPTLPSAYESTNSRNSRSPAYELVADACSSEAPPAREATNPLLLLGTHRTYQQASGDEDFSGNL
ncbi:hypothetical protein B484DRAFT_477665 [Ochromonadaceae sp. CCMP2298]|nr:hypothetical protein B484DRAFT_477665 [Ochromonadaceae sp. CCMP2298]